MVLGVSDSFQTTMTYNGRYLQVAHVGTFEYGVYK